MSRSTIAGVALVGILALIGPAAAAAATQQTLGVQVTPAAAGKPAKPRGATIAVTGSTRSDSTAQPPPVTNIVFRLPAGFRFNTKGFPACSSNQLVQQGKDSCPKGSQVGAGGATALAGSITASPTITAFNGGGNHLELFAELSSPISIAQPIEGTLSHASGPMPWQLSIPVPDSILNPIPGLSGSITDLNLIIGATATIKGKRMPYIETVGCSGGKWPFEGVFSYQDGTTQTVDASVPCH
jgi:hypothetical protein